MNTPIKVKIINLSANPLPSYQTENSSAVDLYSAFRETILLHPNKRVVVPTGIKVQLPPGYEFQIRPRSGLAAKFGITVLNAPGTIDADFRGEIGVILINHGEKIFPIYYTDRIAQMVLVQVDKVQWEPVQDLDDSARGAGGFGSTGK